MARHLPANRRALHSIALFEAFKGLAVLAGSVGLLGLVHHDIRHLAHELIAHLGMNPGGRYPLVLLHYADILASADLRLLILLAVVYAVMRMTEAYGLWNNLAWGEWVGALSGALYIPFEVRHFLLKPSVIGALVFIVNAGIVGFLAYQLYRRHRVPGQDAS